MHGDTEKRHDDLRLARYLTGKPRGYSIIRARFASTFSIQMINLWSNAGSRR